MSTNSTQTFCGKCNHPMHWKECGADLAHTACQCRNDDEAYRRSSDFDWPTSSPDPLERLRADGGRIRPNALAGTDLDPDARIAADPLYFEEIQPTSTNATPMTLNTRLFLARRAAPPEPRSAAVIAYVLVALAGAVLGFLAGALYGGWR